MDEKLTPKQRFFVEEYLLDLNSAAAAIRAGYSAKTAHQAGSRLLTLSNVKSAIKARMEERKHRVRIDADRILEEIARIALHDPRKIFSRCGDLLDIQDWPDASASAISTIKITKTKHGEFTEVKFWDKGAQLALAARHLGLLGIGKDDDEMPEPIDISFIVEDGRIDKQTET
jgi:phage terminase small subunit